MKTRLRVALRLALLPAAFPMLAPEAGAQTAAWSLDSCISYAQTHNISLQRRELRVEQGRMAVTEARDRYLPQVDASAGQSWNFGRGLTADNTYANRNTSSTSWSVGLGLPLFQGLGAYRREKAAELSLRQYVLEADAARDDIELNVTTQYLQVLYNREMAEAARVQAELSEFQLERQRTLAAEGKVAEVTVYDFEASAARDRLQLVSSERDTQTALVSLAALLQLGSADGFDILPLDSVMPPLPSAADVWAAASGANASLAALRQGLNVADANIAVAKSGYMPTLSFNAGLGSSYYTLGGMTAEGFGAQMRHNFSRTLGFSLHIPVFDAFSTRNSVRQARLQRTDAQLALEQGESDLHRDIVLAHSQAEGARDRWETAVETLRKTRLAFDATCGRYDMGRATIADYEQAKAAVFSTEASRIQAWYEYLVRCRILAFYARPRLERH